MDLWMKVGSAVLLIAMLVYLIPRAKAILKETPKGSTQEWVGALIPLGLVLLFILVLIQLA